MALLLLHVIWDHRWKVSVLVRIEKTHIDRLSLGDYLLFCTTFDEECCLFYVNYMQQSCQVDEHLRKSPFIHVGESKLSTSS